MVERYGKPLAELDHSFWSERIGRIHRERNEEVGITQVDIGANLLKSWRCPKDTQYGGNDEARILLVLL